MGGGVNHFPGRRRSIVAARQAPLNTQNTCFSNSAVSAVSADYAIAADKPDYEIPPEPERRKPGRPKKVRA